MLSSKIHAANDSALSVVSTAERNDSNSGSDGKKWGPYVKSKDKAQLGNYAVTHKTSAAMKNF